MSLAFCDEEDPPDIIRWGLCRARSWRFRKTHGVHRLQANAFYSERLEPRQPLDNLYLDEWHDTRVTWPKGERRNPCLGA